MVCILRSTPSAVPRLWIGVVLAAPPTPIPALGKASLDGPRPSHVMQAAVENRGSRTSTVIVASDAPAPYARLGLTTAAADPRTGAAGCVLAGLDWTAAHAAETAWILALQPGDPPLREDEQARLVAAVGRGAADIACHVRGGVPLCAPAVWPVRLRREMRRALEQDSPQGLGPWIRSRRVAVVAESDVRHQELLANGAGA